MYYPYNFDSRRVLYTCKAAPGSMHIGAKYEERAMSRLEACNMIDEGMTSPDLEYVVLDRYGYVHALVDDGGFMHTWEDLEDDNEEYPARFACPDCSKYPYDEDLVELEFSCGSWACPNCGCTTVSPAEDLCIRIED